MEYSQGWISQCSPGFENAVLSLDLFQMSNAAGLTSVHSRPQIMAVYNDCVPLCLLFWMLIYRVNDSPLIEGWKCPILRYSGDITINHSSETQDTYRPGNYSLRDHLPICVCGMCVEGRGLVAACTLSAVLDFTGMRETSFGKQQEHVTSTIISPNQDLNGKRSYRRYDPRKGERDQLACLLAFGIQSGSSKTFLSLFARTINNASIIEV